jgi:hypothetical protein
MLQLELWNNLKGRRQGTDQRFPVACQVRGGVGNQDRLPPLEKALWDVQLPVDGKQKGDLDGVDFADLQAGDSAPCSSRVVPVLKVL